MKIDLIRYWKDPEYAEKIGKSVKANPAGEMVSEEMLQLVGGGYAANQANAWSPTAACHYSAFLGTCGGCYYC